MAEGWKPKQLLPLWAEQEVNQPSGEPEQRTFKIVLSFRRRLMDHGTNVLIGR